MALELYIPPCIITHGAHSPPVEQPLRIQIGGPLVSIQKLLPKTPWDAEPLSPVFPQPAGPKLAKLAFQKIYGREVRPEIAGDFVVRDEYLGWVTEVRPLRQIDYYGVTFDHLVPANDPDPEILQININELDDDDGAYANKYLLFAVDAAEYKGKKILAVPRCCQKKKATQDRGRINDSGRAG
ncbi:Arginine deiminase type-3 [Venustampulla echinocandica]|uniref:Arginine deiminase type-3 n=1 Tax=Venustampulla echinocandica TaxID=2656787 RepID=A0A370TAQ3_9HELO|nr:Arginine deiminase type-3 [Venustampulla echinocandica]RDL31009.1 Arginine deiminase type-3 [Venustampulla echinocandica]